MNFVRRMGFVVTLLAVLGVITWPAHSQFFVMENPLIGQAVPDFILDTLTENNVSLKKVRDNHKAIIFFWATWCPHCREALHQLNIDKQKLEAKNIKIILVNLEESKEEVASYLKRNKIDFDVFLDKDSSLGESYAIIGVPTFFFVNAEGRVQAVEHYMPENYDDILNGIQKKASSPSPSPRRGFWESLKAMFQR